MRNCSILVVDDEVLIAEHLKDILHDLGFNSVMLAHAESDALDKIRISKPNLVLLDIRMKEELEGIAIAEQINKLYGIPFIFVTAHSDAAIIRKAVSTSPAGYITKPYKKMDIYAAVNLVLNSLQNQRDAQLEFKDGYSVVNLPANDLMYAQSEGNYIHLFTARRKYTIRYSLEWLMEQVPSEQFRRVHRSYVVNMSKVERRTSKAVYIGETEIPVGRSKQIDSEN